MQFLIAKSKLPREIGDFLTTVFEIYEVRGRVGESNGVVFKIRSNEGNHSLPHIHAEYGEFEISIVIETGKVLAGNLPGKNQRIAVNWVLEHKDKLMNEWKDKAISALSNMTKSNLSL